MQADNPEFIDVQTRADLIKAGDVVDVSPMAREAGITMPVGISRALKVVIDAIPPSRDFQDVEGRTWDVVWMGANALRRAKDAGRLSLTEPIRYVLHLDRVENGRIKSLIELKIGLGWEGPEGGPCCTIYLAEEVTDW